MKDLKYYENPRIEFHEIQSEGQLCWSGIEELDENQGTWGW